MNPDERQRNVLTRTSLGDTGTTDSRNLGYLGDYVLLRRLGRGGMGEVFAAFDTVKRRHVAVKLLLPDLEQSEDGIEFKARFRRESALAARTFHPNIVPVYTFGEQAGRMFIEMPLIHGHDLSAELENGALAPQRAVHLVVQIAAALEAAHRLGLLHRDVKPSNILLSGRPGQVGGERALLADFGIATSVHERRPISRTGQFVGTLQYTAPERLRVGGRVDRRCDVYSLTCVFFECLTGTRPFADVPPHDRAALTVPRPSLFDPQLSPFDQVVARGLAGEPDRRYFTVEDLAADIERRARTLNRSVVVEARSHTLVPAPLATRGVRSHIAPVARRRWSCALLAVIACLLLSASSPLVADARVVGAMPVGVAATPNGDVAVINGESNSVTIIDPIDLSVVNEYPVVGRFPVDATGTAEGRMFVVDFASDDLTVLDLRTSAQRATSIRLGRGPDSIAASPDGKKLYVTESKDGTIATVDTSSLRVVGRSTPTFRRPLGIATTHDGTRVVVVNHASDSLDVLDAATLKPRIAAIRVGRGPDGVSACPDGRTAYVTNAEDNTVSVVDLLAGQVLGAPIPVGRRPDGVLCDDQGRVTVANSDSDSVTVLDPLGFRPTLVIPVGDHPKGLAQSEDGTKIFVADRDSASVTVIRLGD